jgi:hypothetical protein
MLDVWPALPLVIKGKVTETSVAVAHIVGILGDNNRVCRINLSDNFTI